MFNNEPCLQTVPIYSIKNNGDSQTETHAKIHAKDDNELIYSVGRTVNTGRFNYKVIWQRHASNNGSQLKTVIGIGVIVKIRAFLI